MLSPIVIHLLLKFFDSIDRSVTAKLAYKRPRNEEEITSSLIDALDSECQHHEKFEYSLVDLHNDLDKANEPTYLSFKIDTHPYSKQWESYISQADLGIIIRYENHFEPSLSYSSSWLFQAKRAFPITDEPLKYDLASKFESLDNAQNQRIKRLIEFIGADFFRYLLYCPRPEILDHKTKNHLSYLRGKAIREHIFDYAYGLELRDDIRNGSPTIAAGIFVSKENKLPENLGEVHKKIFTQTLPFSWFFIEHLAKPHYFDSDSLLQIPIIEKLISGDRDTINHIKKELFDNELNIKFLPKATITITVSHSLEHIRN